MELHYVLLGNMSIHSYDTVQRNSYVSLCYSTYSGSEWYLLCLKTSVIIAKPVIGHVHSFQ